MVANASAEDSIDIDWTTDEDDELDINPEAGSSFPLALTRPGQLMAGNGEVHVQVANACGEDNIDVDWTTDDELDINPEVETSSPLAVTRPSQEFMAGHGEASSSRSKLVMDFMDMGFPEERVLEVIEEHGEGNQSLILSILLTYSNCNESPQQLSNLNSDHSSSDYNENVMDDLSDIDCWSLDEDEILDNTASSTQKQKLVFLADMGYTIEEASIAMERCGPETSVDELANFILAAQNSREADLYLPQDNLRPRHMLNGNGTNKRRKLLAKKKNEVEEDDTIRLPNPMIGFGVPSLPSERVHRNLPDVAKGPPFFYYENVAMAPKGAWDTISRHLYDIEPEFVDSKYFCATARKRGYIHNLPTEGRFPLVPLPPMNIYQAFPLSRNYWPSWDPRDKMNCIQTCIGSAKLTERIRDALERYPDTDPPEGVQKYVLEQCRKWNLVWVGKNKAAPMEADEIEMLLGFPKNHTRGGGISRTDRYKSLGNSFQVDTVSYHLSVLKNLFPNGMNVLSLFSGIGGGEVALHRLGIKLKNVVSVEKSKVNRDIVRSWWTQTNQKGNLIDFEDVQDVDDHCLETIISSIGGFDLLIGGSPCNNLAGSNRHHRDGLEGKESSLFFEYTRILESVIMRGR